MTVTVPSTDQALFNLQAQITAVAALVSANANPAVLDCNTQLLDNLRQQLVWALMANSKHQHPQGSGQSSNNFPSFLDAATILSTCTINT